MKRNAIDFEVNGAGCQTPDDAVCRPSSAVQLPATNYQLPTTNYQLPTERKRAAFTLLEVLVASVLMGMLVTILTMIFNQSAIAWRTGKAGVADMTETERKLARIHAYADSVVPFTGGDRYCVVSPWDDADRDDSGRFNVRGLRKASELHKRFETVNGNFQSDDGGNGQWRQTGLGRPDMNGGKSFIVGVRSAGPDRQWETEDDISTWPDEVD